MLHAPTSMHLEIIWNSKKIKWILHNVSVTRVFKVAFGLRHTTQTKTYKIQNTFLSKIQLVSFIVPARLFISLNYVYWLWVAHNGEKLSGVPDWPCTIVLFILNKLLLNFFIMSSSTKSITDTVLMRRWFSVKHITTHCLSTHFLYKLFLNVNF
jgi:hypothetical protein